MHLALANAEWVVLRKGVPRGVPCSSLYYSFVVNKKINVGDFHVSVAKNI